jgi:EmrB/QacA subfamily drug resistance transporter
MRPAPTRDNSPRGLRGLALLVVLSAQLVVVLDFSIVNVALPSISTELHGSPTTVQWVVTAYAITFGGLLVLGGRIADLFGRRRLLVGGLVGFALASAAGGLAPHISVLVLARAVQGIAAAAVAPAALSILTTSFPQGPARTRVLGYYGAMASVGFVAGLVLGGALVDTVGWRGVFYVNVPVCLLGAAISRRELAHEPTARTVSRLDVLGAALVTAAVAVLVYAPTVGVNDGWSSARFLAVVVAGAALLLSFIVREAHTAQPIMPLSIFRSRTLVAGDAIALLVGAWTAGEVLLISLYSQQVLGYTPLVAGLVAVPQGIGGLVRGVAGPKAAARLGFKRFLTVSAVLSAVGLALLFRFPATSHYPLLGVVFFVVGLGTTSVVFAATVAGTSDVADDRQGLASALVNTTRQIGSAIGVAVVVAVAAAQTGARATPSEVAHGYKLALAVTAAWAVVAAVLASVLMSDRSCRSQHERLRKQHAEHPWPVPELVQPGRDIADPPGTPAATH